ncbi:Immediate early response 3-interacting protein 1 [Oryzias melastigma]|uniref:Immediate early response 3-interacting protein 1 n=1 Tax=Oryzias melastigma TaxID=30732 RepID=A0A834F0V6_ORYME|nr:Immediate early response 3-interacting protein 1 [Oryzias melastigma]
MAFTLYSLIQAAILCVNAVAVLHEERFLSKIGWGADQSVGGFGDEPGVKAQLMNLVRSVRTVMRDCLTSIATDVQPAMTACSEVPLLSLRKILDEDSHAETRCPARGSRDGGLVRVRQSLQTLQPVDELKKGPFSLQARVLGYQQTRAGAEVDIRLSATSRSGSTVWESVLTFLSEGRGEQASGNEKLVELQAPWRASFQSSWSFSSCSPQQIFSLAARFLSLGSGTASGLWMLSVCLAEIEKHKGVEVVTSPVKVKAHFTEPLLVPGRVTIRFWDKNKDQSSEKDHSFCMEHHGRSTPLLTGVISRTQFN